MQTGLICCWSRGMQFVSYKSKLPELSSFLLFVVVVAASLFSVSVLIAPSTSPLSSASSTSSPPLSWFFSRPANFSFDSTPPPLPSPPSQEGKMDDDVEVDVSSGSGDGGANFILSKVGPRSPNDSYGTGNSSADRSSGWKSPGGIVIGKSFLSESARSSIRSVGRVLENKIESGAQEKKMSKSGHPFEVAAAGSLSAHCDIFDGRWVWDEKNEPYYPPGSCPYIDDDFNCHKNGRPDSGFLKWRWQPYECDIPRLNATDFLGRLKGKRILFVGDSLNRNMWESLVCILRNGIQNNDRVYLVSGRREIKAKAQRRQFKAKGYYSFNFVDYECFVDYVRSTYLVREVLYRNVTGSDDERLRLDILDDTAAAYHEADVIVFNTGHWWTHDKTSRGINYYQEGNRVYPVLKVMEAYRKALTTWAQWIDKNIDSHKTQVVFRGYSPSHFRGGQWNSGGQCHNETEPIFNQSYLARYPSKMRALESIVKQMRTPVIYLNISRLTDYRKDGHPSIYRMTYTSVEEQIAAERYQDCSHWCLPGVPDSWNELLHASLLIAGKGSWRR